MSRAQTQTIDLGYRPRDIFVPFHRRRQRFACIVAHRRAGKTVAAVNDLVDAALRCRLPNPRFAYLAPYFAQAKDVAWNYLRHYTAAIPGVTSNETELRVDLPNGGRVRLYGADNYDRLRGIYLDGVVLDEYADMDSRAWSEVIRPALADRNGWAAFIGTPKGKNGFYEIFRRSSGLPTEWFTLKLKASETGIIPPAELMALRGELSADEYERELETSFDAAIEGAYYASQLKEAREQGRVTKLAVDPLVEIKAFWDLGVEDSMAIWIAQFSGRRIDVLDYKEGQGQSLAYYVNWLRSSGYEGALCVLPHDGARRGMADAMSFSQHLKDAGFRTKVIPNQGKGAAMQRVEALRRLFPRIWFDGEQCDAGLEALAAYHEKRDDKRDIGLGPEHDWASHASDAAGMMAVFYEEPRATIRPEAERITFGSGGDGGGGWMGN